MLLILRTFLPAAVLVIAAATVQAQPSFQDIRFTHGLFGPERTSTEFHRLDEVCLHYSVTELQTEDNHFDVTIESKVLDPQGAIAFRSTSPAKGEALLGGAEVPGFLHLPLDHPYLPEGEWTAEVTATDNLGKRSATFSRKWQHKPQAFGFSRLGFYRDDQFKCAARLNATVAGQMLYCKVRVVGYAREEGQMEMDLEVQFLDAEGKELSKPFLTHGKHQSDDPSPGECWDFNSHFLPNRPGDFKIRLVAHDLLGKKTVQLEVPFHVDNP